MKVRLTLLLATLFMLAWTSPAQARMAKVCSVRQSAKVELRCGRMNLHVANSVLRFLRTNTTAGDRFTREILWRDHIWLRKYAVWHMSHAKQRMQPSTDGCLRQIIDNEGSHWNPRATNPQTGAYGIPQALPGSKMRSAGADWATNPNTQIRWMIWYVNTRYGGACSALSFWNANHYY